MTNKQWKIPTQNGREVVVETNQYEREGFLMQVSIIDILVLAARIRREKAIRRVA